MANIPEERLQHNYKPFTNTGTDYFGPFYVKLSKATRSNAAKGKKYGVIFACMTTRAVYLEISNDLPTGSFILSLKRFIAQRGQVKRLMSNNGTNVTSAEQEIKETLNGIDQNRITNFLSHPGWVAFGKLSSNQ